MNESPGAFSHCGRLCRAGPEGIRIATERLASIHGISHALGQKTNLVDGRIARIEDHKKEPISGRSGSCTCSSVMSDST